MEIDGRPRHALVRILVAPGADQPLGRHVQLVQQAEYGVGVTVRPAAHGQHRALHRGKILADRAVAPIVVTRLVGQPLLQPQATAFQALEPQVAPLLADQLGVRRQGVESSFDSLLKDKVQVQPYPV